MYDPKQDPVQDPKLYLKSLIRIRKKSIWIHNTDEKEW
jgi:hypothetical protein